MGKGNWPFEASDKDKEPVGKNKPKEGSKKESKMDKKQMPGMKSGGKVKRMATGGMVQRGAGAAVKGKKFNTMGD